MTFGNWLKAQRTARGLTQEGLAQAAENVCTGAYISNLERNADIGKDGMPNRPSEEIVEKLALALSIPVNVARLNAGYAAKGQGLSDGQQMLEYFNGLPEAERDMLLTTAEALYRKYHAKNDNVEGFDTVPASTHSVALVKVLEEK